MIQSPDKFGFYQAGDQKFYSKLEAIQHARLHLTTIHWNFNDEVFSNVDWLTEPQLSLSELYMARCRQIRSEYDYVILFYSGGSDSDNVLEHWLRADCKLDEVATLCSYEGSKDKDSFSDAEQFHVVLPKIQQLQARYSFKFRLIDQTKMILDYVQAEHHDILYHSNHSFTPNNAARAYLRESQSDWKRLIDSGKKVCFLWGMDKIFIDSGRVNFQDSLDNVISPYVQRKFNDGWYDELFYWTPDLPELVVKQAHTVKKLLDVRTGKVGDVSHYFTAHRTNFGYSKRLGMYLTENGYRMIMYPYWDLSTFTVGKSRSRIKSDRDEWLWSSNHRANKVFLDASLGQVHLNFHVDRNFYRTF